MSHRRRQRRMSERWRRHPQPVVLQRGIAAGNSRERRIIAIDHPPSIYLCLSDPASDIDRRSHDNRPDLDMAYRPTR
jgi:hypothetical protein